jgi:glycosyltransferase involved in cell wall biosynthesis
MPADARRAAPTSIALVIPWGLRHVGGVNQVVQRLAGSLARDGAWQPRVLVAHDPDADDRAHQSPIAVDYLALSAPFDGRTRLLGLGAFLKRLPQRLRALRDLLARTDTHTVNVHYPSLAALHFVLLNRLGMWRHRLVLSFHLSDAVQANATTGFERGLWATLLRAADAIVLPTADLGEQLVAIEPSLRGRFTLIPNGVDVAQFATPAATKAALPTALQGRPLIASVGLFADRKGHADLLAALARLKADFPTLGLVIAGADTPYRATLEARRHALGLDNDVAFLPDVPHDQLPAYLQAATLFALATRAETFCIALLEAGAASLPVVTTRAPGVVEVVRDGETALLTDIGDVDALVSAIRRVLEHPDDARAMAARFKQEIERGLTWEHHGARYRELYASING